MIQKEILILLFLFQPGRRIEDPTADVLLHPVAGVIILREAAIRVPSAILGTPIPPCDWQRK